MTSPGPPRRCPRPGSRRPDGLARFRVKDPPRPGRLGEDARAAFLLALAAADIIGFAGLASLAMVAVGAAGVCLVLAGGSAFLAHRRAVRWLALAVVSLAPVTVLVIFARHRLLWVALVAVALIVLAAGAGRRTLAPAAAYSGMPTQSGNSPAPSSRRSPPSPDTPPEVTVPAWRRESRPFAALDLITSASAVPGPGPSAGAGLPPGAQGGR
jgi:hypothetical protein